MPYRCCKRLLHLRRRIGYAVVEAPSRDFKPTAQPADKHAAAFFLQALLHAVDQFSSLPSKASSFLLAPGLTDPLLDFGGWQIKLAVGFSYGGLAQDDVQYQGRLALGGTMLKALVSHVVYVYPHQMEELSLSKESLNQYI